jgi:hypothetical protein
MDERLRFVARLLEGKKMAPLCAEFGFLGRRATRSSTATRIAGSEPSAIGPIARTRQANRRPAPIEATIVRLKREYPGCGAPKIREKLPAAVHGAAPARHQHRPRGAGSVSSGPASASPPLDDAPDDVIAADRTESLVDVSDRAKRLPLDSYSRSG